MQQIHAALEQFGLHNNQVQVYLSLLHLGSATIQDITANSKVKRTSVYKALDNLVLRGMVTFETRDGHRVYFAENPNKALMAVRDEQQAALKKEQQLLALLPELISLYNAIPAKPKIRFYEGVQGLKQIYEETLLQKNGGEILTITPADLLYKIFDRAWVANYLVRRVEKKIHARTIAEDSAASRKHHAADAIELRESRLVTEKIFRFKNEIIIFENKVAIVSLTEQMGIVIESVDVAETQHAIFELAWRGAGKNM